MSILLTVVTRNTTENPVFCVLKAKERQRANQLRIVKLNRQFLALSNETLAKEISMKAFE